MARRTLWNSETYAEVRRLIRRERPQVVHCTNTFPLISPAVYYAARAEGVPVVHWIPGRRGGSSSSSSKGIR
jgi:UDP-N-acetylglucosamine:LPS N-acetylglucosamine transferase